MTVRKILTALLSALGMLVLVLDGQTALAGAAAGLELCLKTVIPSLFPFLFLCSLLTGALWGESFWVLRWLGKLLGVPDGAQSVLIAAALGGYPAGAQAVADACREGRLSHADSLHLLSFCSNAGPAFLFGMIAQQFPERKTVWVLLLIHLFSAFLTGMLHPPGDRRQASLASHTSAGSQHLLRTVRIMGVVCGWILLFRMLNEFLNRWLFWRFPTELRVIFSGFLELSNGCCMLIQIQDPAVRFLICTAFLSFGGLCITMQTASVIGDLSLKPYLFGKLMQSIFSLSFAVCYLQAGSPGLLISCGSLFFIIRGIKKVVDFRAHTVYNEDIKTGRNPFHALS